MLGEIRIDTLLPAVRAFGAETQALRRAEGRVGVEVRSLEQDVGGVLADLRLLAAHDPGERDRPLSVGDHQVVRLELTFDAVERAQLPLGLARLTTILPPASFE